MSLLRPANLRSRLTLWYVAVLAVLLLVYAALVFTFQYGVLTRQLAHDEVQDIVTVEGLLYFDTSGSLQLHQDYFSRPQSHVLVDRLMEVRDLDGNILYRSATLHDMPLGGPNRKAEGDTGFDERVVRLQDGTHVFLVSHIHVLQGHVLLIRLGYSLKPLRIRMMQFLLLLLVAIPLALVLAGAAGQMIARKALRPLDRMAIRAGSMTANNLSDRLEVPNPNDELGQMAKVFNHLLDRLEQAFSQLQRFTADAAHELRTPLAALRTVGEVALEREHDEEAYRDALGNILEETQRLSQTIDSLLLLARAETTQPGEQQTIFAVSELTQEILELLSIVIEEKRVTVIEENDRPGRAMVKADRSLLRVAILNVLHNALKFSPPASVLRITYTYDEAQPETMRIAFQDAGPGIAAGDTERVFERFFTSASPHTATQSGTGLGLSITRLIVNRSGGEIYFDPQMDAGARCVIVLPTVIGA